MVGLELHNWSKKRANFGNQSWNNATPMLALLLCLLAGAWALSQNVSANSTLGTATITPLAQAFALFKNSDLASATHSIPVSITSDGLHWTSQLQVGPNSFSVILDTGSADTLLFNSSSCTTAVRPGFNTSVSCYNPNTSPSASVTVSEEPWAIFIDGEKVYDNACIISYDTLILNWKLLGSAFTGLSP